MQPAYFKRFSINVYFVAIALGDFITLLSALVQEVYDNGRMYQNVSILGGNSDFNLY